MGVTAIAYMRAAGFESGEIGAAYLTHRDLIWRYLWRRTGDRHAADDLVGEVFLAAVRNLPRFQSRGIPVLHWLYRVATRAATRWVRSRARSRPQRMHDLISFSRGRAASREPRGAAPSETEDAEVALARRERLGTALERLPEDQRVVVLLHYLEGLTQREIAALLKTREGTVRSRLSRGLSGLRRSLVPSEVPPSGPQAAALDGAAA